MVDIYPLVILSDYHRLQEECLSVFGSDNVFIPTQLCIS
jgi:hypothetical protein